MCVCVNRCAQGCLCVRGVLIFAGEKETEKNVIIYTHRYLENKTFEDVNLGFGI